MDPALHDIFRTSGMLEDLASGLTRLGGTEVLVAVAVVSVYLLRRAGLPWWGAGAPAASLWFCALVTSMVKDTVGRTRPEAGAELSSMSCPSGHASNTTALAVALALVVPWAVPSIRRRVSLVVASMVSLSIGWTRLALGVHWTTDVIAGWILGGAVALGVVQLARRRATASVASPPPPPLTSGD